MNSSVLQPSRKNSKNRPKKFRQKIAAFSGKTLKNCWTWNAYNFTSRTPFWLIFFLKLGEIVRGTQICNLFEKIRPPTASKMKTNRASVRRKKPWKFADFKTSISRPSGLHFGRFFFLTWVFLWEELRYITCFYKFFTKIYRKVLECRGPLFLAPKKKICKIKNSCPQLRPWKVLWYQLLRTQDWIQNYHNRYRRTI